METLKCNCGTTVDLKIGLFIDEEGTIYCHDCFIKIIEDDLSVDIGELLLDASKQKICYKSNSICRRKCVAYCRD